MIVRTVKQTPRPPTAAEVARARKAAGLTQTQAGELVYAPLRTWQDWEYGARAMPPATWEYFLLLLSSKPVRAARARLRGY
jgi:DNA-binding transcriptional regulator YiaG